MTHEERDSLMAALKRKFAAEVDFEPINENGRYRFAVVSPQFTGIPHLKRQDAIWKVVDEILSTEATMDITLILAYAREDIEVAS